MRPRRRAGRRAGAGGQPPLIDVETALAEAVGGDRPLATRAPAERARAGVDAVAPVDALDEDAAPRVAHSGLVGPVAWLDEADAGTVAVRGTDDRRALAEAARRTPVIVPLDPACSARAGSGRRRPPAAVLAGELACSPIERESRGAA